MDTIICPNCKQPLEINQAIRHQIEEQTLAEVTAKHKKELEEAKTQAKDELNKKIKEQFETQMKRLEEDAKEKDERNKQLSEELSKLFEALRQSKREKEEAQLIMQKKLAQEEEKIRLDAQKKAEEKQRMKILEKDKQLQDAIKANEDLRRKLQQGSQQTQGEAFELEFESLLQRNYPNDKIIPVAKGVRGGDVIHEVWDARGNFVGKILWELKNTKTWNEGWIEKLRNDQRAISAEEAVLISEVLPSSMENGGFRQNIWITQRNCVALIADTLRAKLIQLYYIKSSVQAKDEKMEILYTYLSGVEFKHRVEAIIEAFTNMQAEIEKEKRYFASKWARDEKNIRQVIDSTYGMHGDLKGIIGGVLPQIKGLELLELQDGGN